MSRLLIPMLLCGMCACALQQRDYGVKLCGREFIRAVIFTCGGSRWRKAVDQVLPGPDSNPLLFFKSSSDTDEQFGWTNSDTDKRSPTRFSSSAPLSDLLLAMGAQRNNRDESRSSEAVHSESSQLLLSTKPIGGEQIRSLDLSWLREDRKRRNYSQGLAGLCCNQGCTKNDIGQLC